MANPWELDWTGVKTDPGSGSGGRPKPTPQDMKELIDASAKAQTERDAARSYRSAGQAVRDMGTGPWRAKMLDAITPDEDGGIMDTIGATIGAPFRAMVSDKTIAARDHLKTVNAEVALAGSQQMKGSSSDKDTALMRMHGVGPYKTEAENGRIINQAIYDSHLEGMRAKAKAGWIGRYGSLATPDQGGQTFESYLGGMERKFHATMDPILAGQTTPAPRAAPPSTRKTSAGWGITKVN